VDWKGPDGLLGAELPFEVGRTATSATPGIDSQEGLARADEIDPASNAPLSAPENASDKGCRER
jgi:hypothetical protein